MAITLRKQAGSELAPPSNPQRAWYYVDENGVPSFKDSTGAVTSLLTLDESPLLLKDQSTAPPTVATRSTLYAKDVSGSSEAFVLDGSGAEVQLTNAGSIAAPSGGTPTAWFPSGQEFTHVIDYTGGGGESRVDTGIQIPLVADQFTALMFRYHVVQSDGTFWLGWREVQFFWQGGLPSLPDAVASFQWDADASPGYTALYSAIDVGSDGIVEVAINTALDRAGYVKITSHTFTPTFAIGG